MSDTPHMVIRGGAGPAEAAAIAAAVQHLLEQEAAATAAPPQRPRLAPWVLSGIRPRLTGPHQPWTQATRRASEH